MSVLPAAVAQWLALQVHDRETWVRIPAESGGIYPGSAPTQSGCAMDLMGRQVHTAEIDTLHVSDDGDATRL